MKIVIIAALSEERVIGSEGGGIPWDLPADRRHFRARTAGHALLLGRRTFEEMSGWFGDRRPIVLSRNPRYAHPEAAAVAASLDEALAVARHAWRVDELLVCGGEAVYRLALPVADELVLTHVEARVPGTARFPAVDPLTWREVARSRHPADGENRHPFSIVRSRRIR